MGYKERREIGRLFPWDDFRLKYIIQYEYLPQKKKLPVYRFEEGEQSSLFHVVKSVKRLKHCFDLNRIRTIKSNYQLNVFNIQKQAQNPGTRAGEPEPVGAGAGAA